jgi:hypothetical protein
MGLAIFTKIPIFAMIPLVVFLIFTNNNKNWKMVGLWLIPVVLIPLIWPAYAISHSEFDHWWNRVYWQTHRQTASGALEADREKTLTNTLTTTFLRMPLFLVLGLAGLVFAAIKKDYFQLLWALPFLAFLYFIGFVSTFHIIPLLPVLCISAARIIEGLSDKISYKRIKEVLPFFIITAIAIFTLLDVGMDLTTQNNNNKFAAAALVTRYLHDHNNENITMISNHVYSWIPKYVFHLDNDYMIPEIDPIEIPQAKKVLLVVDTAFKGVMSGKDEIGERLKKVYDSHSKNGTTAVEFGRDRIILPQTLSNGSAEEIGTNLIDKDHGWKPVGKVRVSQTDRGLNIYVKSNTTNKISRNVILHPQLKNLTETPILLSLGYASKSPGGNDNFSFEIREGNRTNNRYFNGLLMDTSGNQTNQLFILPPEIVGKQTEFRFRIITNTTGEHTLNIKRANIISSILS